MQHTTRIAEARTHHLRVYSPGLVPGLLQTHDYATAVLDACLPAAGRPPGELRAAVDARMIRQEDWKTRRGQVVEFLIGEQALYTQVGSTGVMEFQLLVLQQLLEEPPHDTTIAILPRDAVFLAPATDFALYDQQVDFETLTGTFTLASVRDLADYRHGFTLMAEHALTGPAASALVDTALSHLHTPPQQ